MRNTQKVRNILREQEVAGFGGWMFTNKYTNCRTVKCYTPNDKADNAVKRVSNRLKEEFVDATVKFIPSTLWRGRGSAVGSLIVRVPRDY
jgi:hypothetical protein